MNIRIMATSLIVSAVVLIAGLWVDIHATLAAYLVAWVALATIPIGALGVLMMSYMVRWRWTVALRPIVFGAVAALPVVAVLSIPILVGMSHLYPGAADPSALKPFKAVYLAPWFFTLRTVAYFVIWSLLALWLRSAGYDSVRMARAAGVGLIVYALTVSTAGVDWMESLEPDFHSSEYGLLFLGITMLNGLAFAIAGGVLWRRRIGSLKAYSALLLSMILVWSYLHAMQYLVIWSGNIPDEVSWYLERSSHGWQYVLIVLAFGQLIFPFFALLSEKVRASWRWLLGLCALTLVMRGVEAALLILPALKQLGALVTAAMLIAALALIASVLWWTFETALTGLGGSIIPVARFRAGAAAK
jgi:hypothetical protein